MTETVTQFPQTDELTLCIRMTGQVDLATYQRVFDAEVHRRVKAYKKFRLLVFYDENFIGWDPDAAEMNFKSICAVGHMAEKLAYVNPRETKIMLMKLAKPIVGCETRYFDAGELDQALQWIKE
jgi:hypothetical protein